MTWIYGINVDVMPVIAPYAPRKFPKLIPKRLVKRLGAFDPERWTKVLSSHRVDLILNECDCETPVIAEYDHEFERILLQITDIENEELLFYVLQAVMHEFVHVGQSNKEVDDYHKQIDTGIDEYNNYLSLKGEVEAYSHCMFLEVMNGIEYEDSQTFKMYKSTSVKVQKKLQKCFRTWLKSYEVLLNQCLNPTGKYNILINRLF